MQKIKMSEVLAGFKLICNFNKSDRLSKFQIIFLYLGYIFHLLEC